ncbi:tropomyosin alpha-1 chain-like [Palaemon carinicauda]|uniref:tropomyosin alpha-1 chain-like n=1 Tax=Palaemon carinicauda TaxID=392227 RepID=UPI0035B5D1D1
MLLFGGNCTSYNKTQSASRKAEEDVDGRRNEEILKEIAESKEKEVALHQRIREPEEQLEKETTTHTEDEKNIRDDSKKLDLRAKEPSKKKNDNENYDRPLEFHKRNFLLEEELEKTQRNLAIAKKQLELSRNWIEVLKEEIAELDQKQEVRISPTQRRDNQEDGKPREETA